MIPRDRHHADCPEQGPCVEDCVYIPPLQEFRITFGQQYSREQHPRWDEAHPDGWLTIMAADYEAARFHAFALLGPAWSMVYRDTDMPEKGWAATFPRGELARVMPGERLPASPGVTFEGNYVGHAASVHGFPNRPVL